MVIEHNNKVKHKAGVVVYRDSSNGGIEVLLVSARKHKDSWVFPVGTVEDHETLQVTAARECEEESGYLVETEDEIGTVQDKGGKTSTFFTFYKAQITGEKDDYEKDRERKWVGTEQLEQTVAEIFIPIAKSFIQSIT